MNESIMNYVKRKYDLLIGERTAEQIKIEIGSAAPLEKPVTTEIKGRSLIEGIPKTITVDDSEIREALNEGVTAIVSAIRVALERTPPELSADNSAADSCSPGAAPCCDWRGVQHGAVDPVEDSAVGADPDSQHQNGGDGERGGLYEAAGVHSGYRRAAQPYGAYSPEEVLCPDFRHLACQSGSLRNLKSSRHVATKRLGKKAIIVSEYERDCPHAHTRKRILPVALLRS